MKNFILIISIIFTSCISKVSNKYCIVNSITNESDHLNYNYTYKIYCKVGYSVIYTDIKYKIGDTIKISK